MPSSSLLFMYPLIILVLVAIGIYLAVTSDNLSLPVPLGTIIFTILLPLTAAANVFLTPIFQRWLRQQPVPSILRLAPAALQLLQAVLTVVLATLESQHLNGGRALDCSLRGTWQDLWRDGNGRAIEDIQDTFSCCGLNSVKDMAWPRPARGGTSCSELYHRTRSCAVPWRQALQRNSGLGLVIAVMVGILQMIHLVLFYLRGSSDVGRREYKRITQSVGADPEDPLLSNAEEGPSNGTSGEGGLRRPEYGYGTRDQESSPRIEPSGLGSERQQWS